MFLEIIPRSVDFECKSDCIRSILIPPIKWFDEDDEPLCWWGWWWWCELIPPPMLLECWCSIEAAPTATEFVWLAAAAAATAAAAAAAAELLLGLRLRVWIPSFRMANGRLTPCNLWYNPQALQTGSPSALRRHRVVVVVPQLVQHNPNRLVALCKEEGEKNELIEYTQSRLFVVIFKRWTQCYLSFSEEIIMNNL